MIDRSVNPPVDLGPVLAAARSRCRWELALYSLDASDRIALPELETAPPRGLLAWLAAVLRRVG